MFAVRYLRPIALCYVIELVNQVCIDLGIMGGVVLNRVNQDLIMYN